MNPEHQVNYLRDVAPEISAAIRHLYGDTRPFINTKCIAEEILSNPETYPRLSGKSQKHISDATTTICTDKRLCVQQNIFRVFSNRTHRNGGRVLVRDV